MTKHTKQQKLLIHHTKQLLKKGLIKKEHVPQLKETFEGAGIGSTLFNLFSKYGPKTFNAVKSIGSKAKSIGSKAAKAVASVGKKAAKAAKSIGKKTAVIDTNPTDLEMDEVPSSKKKDMSGSDDTVFDRNEYNKYLDEPADDNKKPIFDKKYRDPNRRKRQKSNSNTLNTVATLANLASTGTNAAAAIQSMKGSKIQNDIGREQLKQMRQPNAPSDDDRNYN